MPNDVLPMPIPSTLDADGVSQTQPATAPDAATSTEMPVLDELVIQSRTGWIAIDWREIARYRELLYFLVWRDVKVRYKQTVLGFAWAVLQPLITAVIATIIFGSGAGFSKLLPAGVPYLVFAFLGQVPWQLFATGMSSGGLSLVSQQHLLTKIYFPRLFLPSASIGGALFDMFMAGTVLVCFMIGYHFFSDAHFTPPWTIVFVPLLIIPTIIAAMGMAYTLSALTVTYRDFRFIIPVMVQLWMWLSFVMFPRDVWAYHIVDGVKMPREKFLQWEWVLSLNPMYGIVQAYRGLGLGMEWKPMHLVNGMLVASVLLVFGLFYFRKTERRFADIA